VIVAADELGTTPAVVAVGMEKFLGSQSSIKKPIVLANCGSTWGFTVVVSTGVGGFGPGVLVPPFLHDVKINKVQMV
jgi:hypothetical protein